MRWLQQCGYVVRWFVVLAALGVFGGCGSGQEIRMEDALGRPLTVPPETVDPAAADAPLLDSGPPPGAPARAQ